MALRPHCMMGAGPQVRVELGTPTTPTHLPGNTNKQWLLGIVCFIYNSCLSVFYLFSPGTTRSTTLATMMNPPRLLRAMVGLLIPRPRVTQKPLLHRSTPSTTLRHLARLLCEY